MKPREWLRKAAGVLNRTPPRVRRVLSALLLAGLLCAAASLPWLNRLNNTFSDVLYQQITYTDNQVVVIGMDQKALDRLGPMPWPRSVMADALAFLNADPETAPAAIGIDVLYAGEGADPEADAYLAEEAGRYGNVVVAAAATFGSELVLDGDTFYMDDRAVLAWDPPYPALAEAAAYGHINAMLEDFDSIFRYPLLYVDVPGEGRVYSLARTVYELWCRNTGTPVNPLPETYDNGFFYLPFHAYPGEYYDGISVVDLVDGTVPRDYFAGRIVLIGPYAAGMQDNYRVSVDHAKPMYGVEIQANQIDAFRRGFFPRRVNSLFQVVLLFVICALAQAYFYDRRIRAALPVWLAVSGGWVAMCVLLYHAAGYMLYPLWVPLFVTTLLLLSVAVNYARAQRERRRITETFGRYVDPAILREHTRAAARRDPSAPTSLPSSARAASSAPRSRETCSP